MPLGLGGCLEMKEIKVLEESDSSDKTQVDIHIFVYENHTSLSTNLPLIEVVQGPPPCLIFN